MQKKKKLIITGIVLIILLLIGFVICFPKKSVDKLQKIENLEVESVVRTSTTGGIDGNSAYKLSEQEKDSFMKLLNKVELGNKVKEEKALSSGAVTYYRITFTDGEDISLSPGAYFGVDGEYYIFENQDELWGKFIEFNSLSESIENEKEDFEDTDELTEEDVPVTDKKPVSNSEQTTSNLLSVQTFYGCWRKSEIFKEKFRERILQESCI